MDGTPLRSSAPPVLSGAAPTFWEDRYGVGSFERLMARLDQPCTSFAAIAVEFGVTRERVRQWQQQFRPGAPTGRQRLASCRRLRARRRLLLDPLFRAFYQHACAHLGPGRIAPIRSTDGFRLRTVRIDAHVVSLRDGTGAIARRPPRRPRAGTFVYVDLPDGHFALAPPELASVGADDVRLAPYRDTFAALTAAGGDRPSVVKFVCDERRGPV